MSESGHNALPSTVDEWRGDQIMGRRLAGINGSLVLAWRLFLVVDWFVIHSTMIRYSRRNITGNPVILGEQEKKGGIPTLCQPASFYNYSQ